jgi:hypothetical protein
VTRKTRATFDKAQAGEWDESRCTGRSTAIALRAIADAIKVPGMWIPVRDHIDTFANHRSLTVHALRLAARMDLKFFEGHPHDAGIRCNMLTDNPWEIQ